MAKAPIRLPVSKAFPIPLDVFAANNPMVDFVETLPLLRVGVTICKRARLHKDQ